MKKTNYCDRLEKLSEKVCVSVGQALGGKEISDIACECDKLVSEIEKELFFDFMPQHDREGIAALVHGLCRIVYVAEEISLQKRIGAQKGANGENCILLAKKLDENVRLLKNISAPGVMPSADEFRKLYREGGKGSQRGIYGGATFLATDKLRDEIYRCFDILVEVMLANI